MSTDYSDHYEWHGWDSGEDVVPPEPDKQWLTITEDGEEYAVIVLRTGSLERGPQTAAAEYEREQRAARIVAALNAYKEEES